MWVDVGKDWLGVWLGSGRQVVTLAFGYNGKGCKRALISEAGNENGLRIAAQRGKVRLSSVSLAYDDVLM